MDAYTFLHTTAPLTATVLTCAMTAVQYFSICAAIAVLTPIALLIAYDLVLYTSHVLQLPQYAAAMVDKIHTFKVQQISTTRMGIKLKSLGKKQIYNQKVIYETVASG